MNKRVVSESMSPASALSRGPLNLLWLLVPIALLGLAIFWLYSGNLLSRFDNGAPPVEKLTVERTILDHGGLKLLVRAAGSKPMIIAQVQVDSAYWEFTQDPPGGIVRGSTAWISVPFPWVLGEAHKVTFVTNAGTTFKHEIAVAVPTPVATSGNLVAQALLGAFVGILPVVIGLMFYPVLRGAGSATINFLLAMTIGLLAFLAADAAVESIELAIKSAPIFQGPAMVVLAAAATFLLLTGVARRQGRPTGLALATYVALGIGLHNLGEGLAIGAAFAAGSAGLGAFLVLGFTLHNVTEGIGIAAPILKSPPPLWTFAGLALLAGGPAVVGMWVGSLAYAPHWSALALAIGVGAIAQVIVEVGLYLARSDSGGESTLLSRPVLGGLMLGAGLMYATAMLVKI
jgi:zinc transporter ZupT